MANILLRSPYYEYHASSSALSAKMELSIDGVLQYTIVKDVINGGVLFEISELAKDFIDVVYSGSYTEQTIAITGTVTFYDSTSGAGNVIGTPTNFSHIGFEGYSTFKEGKNFTISDGSLLQSNTIMYVPENTAGVIPSLTSGEVVYNDFSTSATSATIESTGITIKRLCDPRFNPIKVTFVNKFGVLQDIWFDKKSTQKFSAAFEQYKRNIIDLDGSYSTTRHQVRTSNYTSTQSITMNTGFIDEGMNDVIDQLILSEYIWGTIDSEVIPLIIKTKEITHKTVANDKLINYTIDFDYAFEVLNNIR